MSEDNELYIREWAADIRAHSGKSVDADRLDRVADEIHHLRAALFPFAEAYRYTRDMGSMRREYLLSMCCTGKCTPQDLARAAELVPAFAPAGSAAAER